MNVEDTLVITQIHETKNEKKHKDIVVIIRIHGTKKGRLRMWSQWSKSMELEKKDQEHSQNEWNIWN